MIFKETISFFYTFFIYFRIYHNNGEYRRLNSRARAKFSVEVTWLIEKAKFPVQLRYMKKITMTKFFNVGDMAVIFEGWSFLKG